MQIDPTSLREQEKYKLLIGSILPRPIAFVTTKGELGSNVAPFSFFTCVSVNPPMIGFTSMPGPHGAKDTLRNIRETGEFVVNIVSKGFVDKVNISSVDSPPGVSEFELSDLHEKQSTMVQPPRVAESKIHLECKMHNILELGRGPDAFIIGEVVLFHVDDDIMMDRYRIHGEGLEPIGRMAGNLYSVCDNVISVKRKSYHDLSTKPK
jgi:flavin reductase (DIM6/NTAB) family NADH-FMN oxidoreductase RutF